LEQLLPRDLCDAAYRSGSERAWNRADALRVLQILKDNDYIVLGVDIWIPTVPGPRIPIPFVYDWDIERAERSASEFVRAFEWDAADVSHSGKEPYFNILAEKAH
jgi:hypothetical protein